jgi:hypothetical protein
MAPKPQAEGSTDADASSAHTMTEIQMENYAPEEEIRHRAYEIYLERGEQPGRDVEDWLQAERELSA